MPAFVVSGENARSRPIDRILETFGIREIIGQEEAQNWDACNEKGGFSEGGKAETRGPRRPVTPSGLVLAARAEHVEDHQLGVGEKPTFGFAARSFRRTNQRTKMLGLRQRAQMLPANSRQARDFLFGEEFLARRNARQVFRPFSELRSQAVRNIHTNST